MTMSEPLSVTQMLSSRIDYKACRFEKEVRDVDVIFDAVGGDTLERSWGVLKPGGRMITIAADSEGTAGREFNCAAES